MPAAVRIAMPALAVAAALALAGCVPEPSTAPTTSSPVGATPTAGPTATAAATAAASATPAATAVAGFAVPPDCASVYSTQMRATLDEQVPPLNDPGVTLFSSQNSQALELLDSGIPTLRCSWGMPSQAGLATNVSAIDATQSEALQDALAAEGFGCEAAYDGTQCRREQQTINLDDVLVTTGEVHYFRGDGWVSTAYVDVLPAGYTEDIANTLWG